MRGPCGLALLAALALAPALPAGATTVRTGKPAASQPPARTWATREQLRECMDTEDALKTRFGAIEAADEAHDRSFNQVDAEGRKLADTEARLDHDDEAAVHAFNASVQAHNDHVKQLNEQAAQSQSASRAYNADMAAYNGQCASLVVRVEDMDAVMKERRKASAAALPASR